MSTNTSDVQLQDLLSAVTDALLAENDDLDTIIDTYKVPRAQVDRFIHIIRRLHVALVGVQPSRRFARRLKQDLVGTPSTGLVSRVRYLPARVQIAAGVAVVAGFMLLSRRRLIAEIQENQEVTALR